MTSTDKVIEQIAQIIFDNVSGPTFFDRSIQDEHERDVDKAARLIHAALAAENEALRAEVERLREIVKNLSALEEKHRFSTNEQYHRANRAEAQRAAVQRETVERCADMIANRGQQMLSQELRAVPINPDAEAALKRVVDAARAATWDEAADRMAYYGHSGIEVEFRALARPTEGEQDV